MHRLGKRGVQQNLEEAVRLYRLGASHNNLGCLRLLGYCYLHGIGLSVDRFEAQKWFEKAVELGDVYSRYHFVRILVNLDSGEKLDKTRILSLLLDPPYPVTAFCIKKRFLALGEVYLQLADRNGNADDDEQQALVWYNQALRAGATLSESVATRIFRLACSYKYDPLIHIILNQRLLSPSSLVADAEKHKYLLIIAERGDSMVISEGRRITFPIVSYVELDGLFPFSRENVMKKAMSGDVGDLRLSLAHGVFECKPSYQIEIKMEFKLHFCLKPEFSIMRLNVLRAMQELGTDVRISIVFERSTSQLDESL